MSCGYLRQPKYTISDPGNPEMKTDVAENSIG